MSQSLASTLAAMPATQRELFFMSMSPSDMAALRWDWSFWSRPEQVAPDGDWSTWLLLAGRGFGKTRLGAEWIRSLMCGASPLARGSVERVALVAETSADGRDVMVQGPSGILATHPPAYRPRYVKSDRKLTWPNGAVALVFSAEEPDQLRGPEHEAAWCDELAKWRYAQETWDMLQFGMRSGSDPRVLATTTPRPIPLVRELLVDEGKAGGTVVTRGATYDNAANLAPKFLRKVRAKYEGTRLGRQELHAEVLADVPGALWTRAMLDVRTHANRTGAGMRLGEQVPEMQRIVVGVDPSGTSGEDDDANDVGIVAVGQGVDGRYYVLDDATTNLGPSGWGRQVVRLYELHKADGVVAESNFGGAMVELVIATVDPRVPYKVVHASRGKVVRAAPVAALYEQGRVRHSGAGLDELEDQLCSMTQGGYLGRGSPDRVDALVWAITELAFGDDDSSSVHQLSGIY